MSAAVDFARHNFGRHILVDGMARPHHGYHDSHAHGHGPYPQDQQFRQPPQTARLPRLPPMATIQAVTSSPSPVLPDGRDAPYYGAKSTYYSDYATPSPVGQTPPQFPVPSSDSHPVSRRAVDMGRSPTLSSTASDRSSDEIGQELRLRQMGSLHDPRGQGQAPHLYVHQQPPRLRGDTLQRDGAFPPVPGEAAPYSSSVIPNGQSGPPQLPRSPPSTQPSASPRQETKSMSISNLLSSDTTSNNKTIATSHPSSSPTAAAAATAATQPTPTATAARSPTSEYRITVRQQPLAARSCGFGERDRRVIDPPPIVQLTIHDEALSRDELGRRLRHQFSVVHCSIWDDAGARDMGGMPDDFRQQRRLMGTLVASPFVGADERGDEGCFFCFPDLSCRTPGAFRLKFALVVLDPARMHTGDRSAIVATAMSEPFHVYNAKDFPGMQASTPLTKRLKEQGCLISIKKGNEKREASGGAQGMGEDDEDDEEEEEEEGKSGGAVGGGGGGGGGRSSSAAEGKGRVRKRVKR